MSNDRANHTWTSIPLHLTSVQFLIRLHFLGYFSETDPLVLPSEGFHSKETANTTFLYHQHQQQASSSEFKCASKQGGQITGWIANGSQLFPTCLKRQSEATTCVFLLRARGSQGFFYRLPALLYTHGLSRGATCTSQSIIQTLSLAYVCKFRVSVVAKLLCTEQKTRRGEARRGKVCSLVGLKILFCLDQ